MQKIPVTRERKGSDILLIPASDVVKIESLRNKEYLVHTTEETYYMAASLEAFEEWLYEEGFRLIDQMNLVNMHHVKDYDAKKGAVILGQGVAPVRNTNKGASAAWIYGEHIVTVMGLLEKMKKMDEGILPTQEDDEIFENILAQEEDHRFARSYAMIKALYDKKKAELLLEESELRYKSLFEHNPDPIISVDLQGTITSVNPALLQLTGYEAEALLKSSLDIFIYPDHVHRWLTHLKLSQTGGAGRQFEMSLMKADGSLLELSVQNFPIYVNRKIAGVYLIGQNISERKRAEEMIIRSEKLSIVGQMAAGVAHEIRNPLTSLKGFVQLMQTKVAGFDNYFEIMREELDRINFIVSEFLVIAKPQSLKFMPKDPLQILQSTIMLIGSQALMNKIAIVTDCQDGLPYINCDENQIKQVFINILNNAIDAMPDGGEIRIELSITEGDAVRIRFIDQGCGIAEERIASLGEPFYTTKDKGTGLGLMVTFKIIENHLGIMKISSEVGQGTTVDILLPGVPREEAE